MSKLPIMLQAFFSTNYYRYIFFTSATVTTFLATFGVLWLVVEITTYFSPLAGEVIRENWKWFLCVGILWTLWQRKPLISISECLVGRDVELEIRIGNILDIDGAYVISTNTTFDTDISKGIIALDSLQGQFTSKFYDSVTQLDFEIEEALTGQNFIKKLNRKTPLKNKLYPIGTVVKLRPKGQVCYLVAVSNLNEHGVAQSSFENIKVCLAEIWEYISKHGNFDSVVIPIIGSGRARVLVNRETFIREIIQSFIAACGEKKFCEKFTLVISPADYQKYNLNLYELGEYLRYVCRYTEFKTPVIANSQKNKSFNLRKFLLYR